VLLINGLEEISWNYFGLVTELGFSSPGDRRGLLDYKFLVVEASLVALEATKFGFQQRLNPIQRAVTPKISDEFLKKNSAQKPDAIRCQFGTDLRNCVCRLVTA